jgi:hypothetical protein
VSFHIIGASWSSTWTFIAFAGFHIVFLHSNDNFQRNIETYNCMAILQRSKFKYESLSWTTQSEFCLIFKIKLSRFWGFEAVQVIEAIEDFSPHFSDFSLNWGIVRLLGLLCPKPHCVYPHIPCQSQPRDSHCWLPVLSHYPDPSPYS